MELSCYNSYYEVDLGGILENYERIRRYIAPAEVIPVIKANAYGMGTVEVARAMAERGGCPVLACAQVFEGLSIREAGILSPEILIIGPVADATIPHAVRNDLQIPLYTPQGVLALSAEATRQGKHVRAQIKIETGMNRMGARPGEELEQLLSTLAQCPNIEITGAYTHFVQAEIAGDEVTRQQFQRFQAGIRQIRDAGLSLRYVHCCNTGATEWFQEAVEFSTHVRVGSLFLGYSDLVGGSNPIGVQDVLSWRGTVAHVKTVYPGETVSYDCLFKPDKPTDIALVGVGFADGLFCPMCRHDGPVLVNGVRTHFIDTCMDQCFIDVTGIPCKAGDEVTFFGHSKTGAFLSPQEFSKYGQIYTAYTASAPERVKRIYI